MHSQSPEFLVTPSGESIAWRGSKGASPTLVWLGGLHSDMEGSKALALHDWAMAHGQGFLRFDYRGHGQSDRDFADCTIDHWRDDTILVLDQLTQGPLILVASSMGAWMALLAQRLRPERIVGLCLIAPAPDFTEALMWVSFSDEVRHEIMTTGFWTRPSDYDPKGYPITRALIESGRENLVLGSTITFDGPVRILHGQADPDVPWQGSLEMAALFTSKDVRLTLIKDGDHRLSHDQDIGLLRATIAELVLSIPSDATGR